MKEIKNVQVIGCGNIGTAVIEDMIAREVELVKEGNFLEEDMNVIWGVDKDESKQKQINLEEQEGKLIEAPPLYEVFAEIKEADAHIISVYSTDQIFEVLNKIPLTNNPIIMIESTIDPARLEELNKWQEENKITLVLFPHRFNPNDPAHRVFNTFRLAGIIGPDYLKVQRFIGRYSKMVVYTDPKIACISKPLENAYRFIEIAIAEEIRMLCDVYKIDHKELIFAMNTKWNIDIKEAKEGIGGFCLPKDSDLILNNLLGFSFLETAKMVDEKYEELIE